MSKPILVPGGWYQPTTRQQRDELHAIIRRLHRLRFPQKYAAVEAGGATVSLSALFPLEYARHSSSSPESQTLRLVSLMARELPLEELHSIVTPSGYARLGRDGKPYKAGDPPYYAGVYPYATPSLRDGDDYVVLAQVTPTKSSHFHAKY
jgi:hypothetical protein